MFHGRTAVITGCGGGIGRYYALEFAKRGANVVVNDVEAAGLESLVKEIKASGGNAVPCNKSVLHGEEIVKSAMDSFGKIDILVNNAGYIERTFPLMEAI